MDMDPNKKIKTDSNSTMIDDGTMMSPHTLIPLLLINLQNKSIGTILTPTTN